MAEIRLERVTKIFDKKIYAVDDVNLVIADEEFMVLLGPSGCGKTTLLRIVAGLEYPEAGRILIDGRDITNLPPRKRGIAMVFQSYAVFPHLKVFENIAFGLRMQGTAEPDLKRRVKQVAELVELQNYLNRYPSQLSGGQRQRVAVARAIVMEPAVLLMDEPLSNLDALLRLNFRAELKKLVKEIDTTTIYVTHDQIEALSLGDRIAVMREGRILQCDTPIRVYDQPTTRFVGSFIGSPPMNFLFGRWEHTNGHRRVVIGEHALSIPAPTSWEPDHAELLVGIRAENIEAHHHALADALPALIDVVEPLGSHLLVTAFVDDQRIKLLTSADFSADLGMQLWLQLKPDKLRLFDAETHEELSASHQRS
jgi:multiple sugar transport system ATP-binding protein